MSTVIILYQQKRSQLTLVNEGASVKAVNLLKGKIAEALNFTEFSKLGRINKRIRTVVAIGRSR
ncbi:hypothetical protein JP39_07710 [Companilactobacillus heilongjiangensis]|uniref:Uncharacterized protein n=1 Tax=Companilactobacillus heilongjiangensis TaxID=1074467 RepID=A0A0K2LD75_9LACO|nr:hypothetical protein JP39_07710 [Companilactobacillus heilongjiangensis]